MHLETPEVLDKPCKCLYIVLGTLHISTYGHQCELVGTWLNYMTTCWQYIRSYK